MMGIDDFFLSFIASYLAGLLPSLKDIFIRPVRGQVPGRYEKWLKKLLRYHLYGKFLYIRSMKY